ncbi:MAG: 7TM diverse intracellular signaling domain-containing protein, partial [Spirochaetota bacterium]
MKLLLLSIIFACLHTALFSAPVLKLSQQTSNSLKVQSVDYYSSQRRIPLERVIKIWYTKKFSQKKFNYFNAGISSSYHYLHFRYEILDNSHWVLELPFPALVELEILQITKSGSRKRLSTGFEKINSEKLLTGFYQFPLLAQDREGDIFIQLRCYDPLTTPILLWKQKAKPHFDMIRSILFGIFYGVIASLSLYNFLLFVTIKDRAYLYYVGYTLSYGFFLLYMFGHGNVLLEKLQISYSRKLMPVLAISTSIFGLAFARKFLNVYEFHYKLWKLSFLVIAIAIVFFMGIPFLPMKIIVFFGNIHPLTSTALILSFTIIAIRKRYKPAYYFSIAWYGLLVSALLYILSNLNVLEANFYTLYLQFPAMALEAILLSLALGYRINTLRRKEEQTKKDMLAKEILARKKQETLSQSFKRFVPE